MQRRFWGVVLGTALATVLVLTGCGGGGGGGGAAGGGTTLEVSSDGENIAFKQTTLEAPANTEVKLTFKDESASQQHNLVLVKGGDDVAAQVVADAITAGPPNYLPAGLSAVAANTAMLNGGQSETVTFNLPPGTYTYLCTFPGHYPAMKGTLTVK